MKIRIKGNSVRFRLSKSEVEAFCRDGRYSEDTHFNDKVFSYGIESNNDVAALDARFENDSITILVPAEIQNYWASSDQIGFDNTISTGNDNKLFLLLEKDFVCLDETIEDQSDNYPNPKADLIK